MSRFVYIVASALLCGSAWSNAQDYPNRPIRLLVPTAAGGGSDVIVRPVAQRMGESMKQTFVVDNRAGASGIIAMEIAAKAPPDGYTIVFATIGNIATNYAILPKLPFHPIKDFVPITKLVDSPFLVVVYPGLPINTVADLVAQAKKQPGTLTYGTFGVGSFPHLLFENFGNIAGVKFVHVPYKGSAPAQLDLLAGQISMMFDSMQSAMPHVRSQRLRAIAIGTKERQTAAPDVPTFVEAGYPDFEAIAWWGMFAPAGTPGAIVKKLHDEIVKALKAPEVRERLQALGAIPVGNTGAEFAVQIKTAIDRYVKVARESNIRSE